MALRAYMLVSTQISLVAAVIVISWKFWLDTHAWRTKSSVHLRQDVHTLKI